MPNVGHARLVPNESILERRSREIIKLVRKLRWIGDHDQANELERQFRLALALAHDSVLPAPRDTELTRLSRADSVRSRMASCAVAALYAHARRRLAAVAAA